MSVEKYAVVTTSHRDVWYGLVTRHDESERVVELEDARHCYYFGTSEGLGELAQSGPGSSAKIGAEVPSLHLHDVVCVMECTDDAVERFSGQGWGDEN